MRNRPYGFEIYLVKTMKTIAQIFMTFSEKLNFTVPIIMSRKHFRHNSNFRKRFNPLKQNLLASANAVLAVAWRRFKIYFVVDVISFFCLAGSFFLVTHL